MPTPHIHITPAGTAPVVISLSGEHDVASSRELQLAVQQAVDAGLGVVCDLTGATFIDSTILRALVDGHRTAVTTGVPGLAVVAPPGSIPAQLFDLVHASEVLPIFTSRDAALANALRS